MKKILLANANYYEKITKKLVTASINVLKKKKLIVSVVEVPGVLEIPIVIRRNINKFDAFVALGCVIKGKTPHFDLITKTTFQEILSLSIKYNKPITNGIITASNKDQALERSSLKKSNKKNKGHEAATAVLAVLKNGPKKI